MKFEFKDLEKLEDKAKMRYFEHRTKTTLLISLLEEQGETARERFILENSKFDLLDKDITIMHERMPDETLNKIADVYEKARIELEKIVDEAEAKE